MSMKKSDLSEAVGVVRRMLIALEAIIMDTAAAGIAAKAAIGQTWTDAAYLIGMGTIGPSLDNCFDLVRKAGCTLGQMETIRIQIAAEKPKGLPATWIMNSGIQLALAHEGKIIGATTFTSRQDVDALLAAIQQPFADAEEKAADTMDSMIYRALVQLHAAVVNHLVETARPLPIMLAYEFATVQPSLVISQRLYGNARRYDEIRNENKIVHPAFCPPTGVALSQ
jgi:hypothetical protein